MAITRFGKFCRKLRMERGELLYHMAQKLGASSSHLSMVEHGKRKLPTRWKQIIISEYNLSDKERIEFEKLEWNE